MEPMISKERLPIHIPRLVLPLWERLNDQQRLEFDRLFNSATLILGRVSSSGLGFITWLIIARLFETREVGVSSGIVSAMMLCVQLSLLGVGSAIIRLLPRYKDSPSLLVNTSLMMVAASSAFAAILFLLLSSVFFRELNVASASLPYSILFLAIIIFGTVNTMMDHVSIAAKRGDQVFTRNVAFGVTAILTVSGTALLAGKSQSFWIVFAWAAAGLTACVIGAWQMRRSLNGYRFGFNVDFSIGRELIGVGLPNYILTLTERVPNWILPILITELLSPTDNAHWYQIWMMAWVVFLVPISIGQNLFAEISHHAGTARKAIRRSLRTSLLMGGAAALAVIVMAPVILSLLGKGYVEAGVLPLRILTLAVFPVTVIQMYYAVCRGTHRLTEASFTGLVNGLVSISVCVAAGLSFGITGMAVAWLATQSLASFWALLRIFRLFNQLPSAAS